MLQVEQPLHRQANPGPSPAISSPLFGHPPVSGFLLAGLSFPSSLLPGQHPLRCQHGINISSANSHFLRQVFFFSLFLNLTISALTRYLVQLQTLPPVVWLLNKELLAHFRTSLLEATPTFSTLNIECVYHRAGTTAKPDVSPGAACFFAWEFKPDGGAHTNLVL